MPESRPVNLDVLIFGGGVAGLWLLDELRRRCFSTALIESAALGAGQTIASQGIIHGGLKYTLDGVFSASADTIRDMPLIWRDCLRGTREPRLTHTNVHAEHCHLWRTDSLRSRLGMIGAAVGLRVAPQRVAPDQRPAALAGCPGDVFRLDEQVIDVPSLLADLAQRNADALILATPESVNFERSTAGRAPHVTIRDAAGPQHGLTLRPSAIVLAAGAGNAELISTLGLRSPAMQRRPLHMLMLRGQLPALNGHCTDGARTRVTITTATDAAGRTVWTVGGQLAEDGVERSERELIAHGARELRDVLPGVSFTTCEWATYRVDRAEPATPGRRRPSDVFVQRDGDVITAWPTKLALAPRLADRVAAALDAPSAADADMLSALRDRPRPAVALPPWEEPRQWSSGS